VLKDPLGYCLYVTNLERVWESLLCGQYLINYKRKHLPQLISSESELMETLKKHIYSDTQSSKYSLSPDPPNGDSIVITLESKIGFFPFNWSFHCKSVSDSAQFLKNYFIFPLFVVQSELNRRLLKLEQIITDKDRQIMEYQKSGLRIPKSLQFPVFDKSKFELEMNQSPEFLSSLTSSLQPLKESTNTIITTYQQHNSSKYNNNSLSHPKAHHISNNKDEPITFSLELRDTETPPTSPVRKTRNPTNGENRSLSFRSNSSPAIPETAEELERRKLIKDKLKKEKEKREQEKNKIRKKKICLI
jgi:hypothetical protein